MNTKRRETLKLNFYLKLQFQKFIFIFPIPFSIEIRIKTLKISKHLWKIWNNNSEYSK